MFHFINTFPIDSLIQSKPKKSRPIRYMSAKRQNQTK